MAMFICIYGLKGRDSDDDYKADSAAVKGAIKGYEWAKVGTTAYLIQSSSDDVPSRVKANIKQGLSNINIFVAQLRGNYSWFYLTEKGKIRWNKSKQPDPMIKK